MVVGGGPPGGNPDNRHIQRIPSPAGTRHCYYYEKSILGWVSLRETLLHPARPESRGLLHLQGYSQLAACPFDVLRGWHLWVCLSGCALLGMSWSPLRISASQPLSGNCQSKSTSARGQLKVFVCGQASQAGSSLMSRTKPHKQGQAAYAGAALEVPGGRNNPCLQGVIL